MYEMYILDQCKDSSDIMTRIVVTSPIKTIDRFKIGGNLGTYMPKFGEDFKLSKTQKNMDVVLV